MSTLVIGVRLGEAFYVDDTPIHVSRIDSEQVFYVKVNKSNEEIQITEEQSIEVLPNVRLSTGRKGSDELARVVIQAPKSIRILRESLYRRHHGGNAHT